MNPIKLFTWNVCGAGSRAFLNSMFEYLRLYKPAILALFETHISGDRADEVCRKLGFSGRFRVEAHGFAGGIWVLWDAAEVQLNLIRSHSQYVTMEVSQRGLQPWFFTAVYASPMGHVREALWGELERFAGSIAVPWLLAGDFNETKNLNERDHDLEDMARRCSKFSNMIENNELIDLGFSGPRYTWARGRTVQTRKSARLDRALCNSMWRTHFQEAAVRHLPHSYSDHCPLLINPMGFADIRHNPKPFRFQVAWMEHRQFDEFIHTQWRSTLPLGTALSKLSAALCDWNKEVFGNLFRRKRQAWARLKGVQQRLAAGGSIHLLKLENKLRKELNVILKEIELLWFQKSRVDAIRDGDRNTKYFHISTIIRRRINRIDTLRHDDGHWVTDTDEVKRMVVEFFAALFTDDMSQPHLGLPSGFFPQIAPEKMDLLAKPYAVEEVFQALRTMAPLKAPGPDGFQAFFYQKYWTLVGRSVCDLVLGVLNGGHLPEGLNDTFLTLIPKVDNPQKVTQFRPIGLCNVAYKLITKVLVQRLKHILPDLISPYQASFVPGRQITDNIVIMQEALHTMRRKKGLHGLMAIKLDLEKAYDKLNWNFIRSTLLDMRLPQLMVDVIMRCISSCSMRVLWNGEPTECFTPSRGVRQGDPLSPYIFVACVERLSQLIECLVQGGQWRPLRVCKNGPQLSRLLFADDIILFAEATEAQARLIHDCLDRFCAASGQTISASKSKIYFSPNTDALEIDKIKSILEMDSTDDLGKYLGVPTINGRVTRTQYSYILERMEKRLAGWKTSCLSLAGRTTLIQSTLAAIPSYTMQSARLPRSVCDEIDRKVRRFLWGGTTTARKIHLVHWNTVTKPKALGGLGIHAMRQLNSAFLAKLGWRVLHEPDSFWVRVLHAKYCRGRSGLEALSSKTSDSHVWRGITGATETLQQGIGVAVANGRNTMFWTHKWVGPDALATKTHSPPAAEELSKRVCDYWDDGRGWRWTSFNHLLPVDTLQRIASYELFPMANSQDQLFWRGSCSGRFTIKSALSIIRKDVAVDRENYWTRLWKIKVPQRVKAFAWLLLHDKLMLNANRLERGLTDNPSCGFCANEYEDRDHVFRRCPRAISVWNAFAYWNLGRKGSGDDFLCWCLVNLQDTEQLESWPSHFLIILWYLWKWRNYSCFDKADRIPYDKVRFLQVRCKDILQVLNQDAQADGHGCPSRRETLIHWQSPPAGWKVLNTDGASKGNPGTAGGGGVIRGDRGEWICGFGEAMGICSSMKAEIKAVLRGLKLAFQMNIDQLWVQVDSATLAGLLKGDIMVPAEHQPLLHQCHDLLQQDGWRVIISHCYREANKVADALANIGCNLSSTLAIFDRPPPEIQELLFADSIGVGWPRTMSN